MTFLRRAKYCTIIQITNWRWSWPQMMLTGIFVPVLLAVGLGVYARGGGNLEYAVVGGVVFSLLFELMNKVASNVAFMRTQESLDLLIANGVRRSEYLIGTFAAFLLLSLPAVIITPIAAGAILGFQGAVNFPAVFIVIFLGALTFMSLGVLIGTSSRTLEQASSMASMLAVGLVALGAVAIPANLLPQWLVYTGYANPAYYIASALRNGLFHNSFDPSSIAVVLCMAVACTLAAIHSMRWALRNA